MKGDVGKEKGVCKKGRGPGEEDQCGIGEGESTLMSAERTIKRKRSTDIIKYRGFRESRAEQRLGF